MAHLSKAEKDEVVTRLNNVLERWPPSTQQDLVTHNASPHWTTFEAEPTGNLNVLQVIGEILRPWRLTTDGQVGFNSLNAVASRMTCTDAELAGFILAEVLVDRFLSWVRDGPKGEIAVRIFAEHSRQRFELPEEIELVILPVQSSKALQQFERVVDVVHVVATGEIPESTPEAVFDDMELLWNSSAVILDDDIFAATGQALVATAFWKEKFERVRSVAQKM